MSDLPALWVTSEDGQQPAYTADILRKFFASLLAEVDVNLNVRQPGKLAGLDAKISGRNVTVNPGVGIVKHNNETFWVLLPTPQVLPIPAAHATYARRDIVTLSMSGGGAFGGKLTYVEGVASSSPQYPTTSDLVVAKVYVPRVGAATLAAGGDKVLLRGGNLPVAVTKGSGVSGTIRATQGSGQINLVFDATAGSTRTFCTIGTKCRGTGIVGNATDQYPVSVNNGIVSFLVDVPRGTSIIGSLTLFEQ